MLGGATRASRVAPLETRLRYHETAQLSARTRTFYLVRRGCKIQPWSRLLRSCDLLYILMLHRLIFPTPSNLGCPKQSAKQPNTSSRLQLKLCGTWCVEEKVRDLTLSCGFPRDWRLGSVRRQMRSVSGERIDWWSHWCHWRRNKGDHGNLSMSMLDRSNRVSVDLFGAACQNKLRKSSQVLSHCCASVA